MLYSIAIHAENKLNRRKNVSFSICCAINCGAVGETCLLKMETCKQFCRLLWIRLSLKSIPHQWRNQTSFQALNSALRLRKTNSQVAYFDVAFIKTFFFPFILLRNKNEFRNLNINICRSSVTLRTTDAFSVKMYTFEWDPSPCLNESWQAMGNS